jgi:sensor histidine kinase YesM
MQANFTKPFYWILDGRYRILFHILFWMVIYVDELFSLIGLTEPIGVSFLLPLITILIDLILVYTTLYAFIPKFLFKGKTVAFFLSTFGLLLLCCVATVYVSEFSILSFQCSDCEPYTKRELASIYLQTCVYTGTVLTSAIGIKMFKEFARNQQIVNELRSSNLEHELAYLKEQINPHFLFNALNNIYVQTRKRPEEAPESILLLSDLLRYQLYDSAQKKVRLDGEIEYLKNYLKLDKLRKSEGGNVTFTVNGYPNGHLVAPFIFLPFVENALKHGSIGENSFLKVQFDITETDIKFTLVNSKLATPHQDEQGGIGLSNVQRRLELLYPERHKITVNETAKTYGTVLDIMI